MLLVTTADERTWDDKDEILFLGDWCRLAKRREAWEGLKAQVVPYHWNDRAKMHRDAAMLSERYEALLPNLAALLDAAHGTQHGTSYWRLVAGPWLRLMMAVLWDRSEGIQRAIAAGATRTRVFSNAKLPALSFDAMADAAQADDLWNHALAAAIIARAGRLAVESAGVAVPSPLPQARPAGWKDRLRGALRLVARLRPRSVFFCNMYAKPRVLLGLELALGQIPAIAGAPMPREFTADPERRNSFRLDCGDDLFGLALSDILPAAFPATLLEGYAALRREGRAIFPETAKAIVTANAQHNELFCIWAAEQRAKGVPLAVVQHGGHYGTDLIEQQEEHERASADAFISWGWPHASDKVLPLPALKLQGLPSACGTNDGDFYCVFDSGHRYPNRIYCVPFGGQRIADNALQLDMLAALPAPARQTLRVRCHPNDDGFGFRAQIAAAGLSGAFDTAPSMALGLQSARLCLVGCPSTSLLEAMASGVPTLALYDARFGEERLEAKPYFDALRAAGILHHSTESVTAQIAKIWPDPKAWWSQPDVAQAHRDFVRRFAWTVPDWRRRWRDALKALAR